MAREKVTKKTRCAIIMYHDPDTGEYRRVVFGDAEETFEMFIEQAPIVFDRLQELNKKMPKDVKGLRIAIEETKPEFARNHGTAVGENGTLTLSYQVEGLE